MSKNNRKVMYEKLKANGKKGLIPDLSQDDGSLEAEFGKAPTKKELTAKEIKAKETAETLLKKEMEKNK